MKMHQWTACEAFGSFFKLTEYKGGPWLLCAPMLLDGTREANAGDVELRAFSEGELPEFCATLAPLLDATPAEIQAAIRG